MLLYTRNLTSKVPVHIFLLENIVNYVFEDLRKPKAPNKRVTVHHPKHCAVGPQVIVSR
jgi:hypothetical protein